MTNTAVFRATVGCTWRGYDPDTQPTTSPRVGLGGNEYNTNEAFVFTRDDIPWPMIPPFEVVTTKPSRM